MKEGHLLILDEVDHMPAECSSVMHSVMEPGGKLVLTSKGGEVISPHPNFRVVGTANTAGFGDDTGLHPNAQVQDFAFLSRFDCVFRVSWMGAADERDLLVKATGVRKADAELIVRIASDTRRAMENGDLMYPVTLRQTLAWAQTSQVCELSTGFALAVLNKLPDHDVAAVAEIAQRHFGDKLGGVLADVPAGDAEPMAKK
jgi:cobaltochelatase CobS